MGEITDAYKILVRRPEVKRPLGRPRHNWEGTININFREIGWEVMKWIYLA
jgi:hypothetical protein